ncbi:hypothetical protein UFOVP134_28 [uncultured Caudovirales phage]|uniref:Uncharacterized protein n=1 Tax=uncultured Caudovirales phage TaxID=2100421 RepID=A0A6J5LKF1_9CAUD|nr:hypothetical protein UFOVP134_28 [uncultured Caudovirales phage]
METELTRDDLLIAGHPWSRSPDVWPRRLMLRIRNHLAQRKDLGLARNYILQEQYEWR